MPGQHFNEAKILAENAGFNYATIDTGSFYLASYSRGLTSASLKTINIYIEGDGLAWKRYNKPSLDPTPTTPLVLNLALSDPAQAVVYLARPCQYLLDMNSTNCSTKLWTSHRYSNDIIEAMNKAITLIVESTNHNAKLHLIGYSGGGTIVSLIAARRTDVSQLTTLAANLDHASWTSHHHITPLYGSLNAITVAKQIASIPQVHFYGADDTNVPALVVDSFFEKQGDSPHSYKYVLKSINHTCCWLDNWLNLLRKSEKLMTQSSVP